MSVTELHFPCATYFALIRLFPPLCPPDFSDYIPLPELHFSSSTSIENG